MAKLILAVLVMLIFQKRLPILFILSIIYPIYFLSLNLCHKPQTLTSFKSIYFCFSKKGLIQS